MHCNFNEPRTGNINEIIENLLQRLFYYVIWCVCCICIHSEYSSSQHTTSQQYRVNENEMGKRDFLPLTSTRSFKCNPMKTIKERRITETVAEAIIKEKIKYKLQRCFTIGFISHHGVRASERVEGRNQKPIKRYEDDDEIAYSQALLKFL